MTPDEALSRVPDFAGCAGWAEQIHQGPASVSYRIARYGEQFILRIDTPLVSGLGLNRLAEYKILQAVAAEGIAPEPVAALPEQGILITRFIDGRPWADGDMKDPGKLRHLADLLKRLHHMPPAGPDLALREVLNRYAHGVNTAQAYNLAGEADVLLCRLADEQRAACLCHHDAVVGNIILDGRPGSDHMGGTRLWLIDWEYAAVGDPYFDLAVTIQHQSFSEDQTAHFLQAYFGDLKNVDHWRLQQCRALYDRVLLLWLMLVTTDGCMSAAQRRQHDAASRRIQRQTSA
jgi:thiamine kinase